MAGFAATEKIPVPVAVSVPFVTVTVRAPTVAPLPTVMFAIADVSELADMELTVTPAPKLAPRVPNPLSHVVPLPVRVTFSVWPRLPVLGLAAVTVGAARIVNAAGSVSD